MKKSFFTLMLLLALVTTGAPKAHAIFGVGDVVFDPTAFGRALVSYAQQGAQLVKETVTAGAGTITAAQTTLTAVNQTVLIPMQNGLTLIAILRSGDMIRNLISGALGTDPLLVKDPEAYIKGKGKEVVRASLGDLAKQDGIYSDSALKAVIAKAKYDNLSLSSKIASINQSGLPAMEQKERCTSSALSAQAIRDVSKSDGTYSQADYKSRYQDIYKAICGDLRDKNTQNALLAVSKASPSLNSFLAITQGDNQWNKTQQIKQEIAQAAAQKIEAAKTDLLNGGGIRSETKCVKKATDDGMGGVLYDNTTGTSVPCIKEEITKAASVLSASYKEAIAAPLKTLQAGFGSGAGSLIGTAFNTMNLLQGISSGLGDISGSNSSSGSGNSSGNTSGSNGSGSNSSSGSTGASGNTSPNNTTITKQASYTKDLVGNPQAQSTLTSTPIEQLQAHKKSLAELASVDARYLTAISAQRSSLLSLKACYDSILTTYPEDTTLQSDGRFSAAKLYYEPQLAANALEPAKIINEKNLVTKGTAIIDQTIATLQASVSTEEILNTFLAYQKQINTEGIPGLVSGLSREGDYTTYVNETQQARGDGGQISQLTKTCEQVRADADRRNNSGNGSGSTGGI